MDESKTIWDHTEKRLDALWNRTETMIIRFFEVYGVPENGEAEMEKDEESPLPKMTEFNVIVAAIKRLQEARIAMLREAAKHETDPETEETDSKGVQEEISRVLEALEKNGCGSGTD